MQLDAVETALAGLPPWLALVAILGGSLVLARLVQVGGDWLIKRLTTRIPGDVDDVALKTIHPALYASVLLAGAYYALEPLSLGVVELPQGIDNNLRATIISIGVVVWAYTLIRLGRRVSHAITSAEDADGSVVPIFQNVWSAGLIGLTAFALLELWGQDVTPLLASAGVIGIIVGFAARDTIANLFGSIALFFDGTYKVGDWVVLEGGDRGRVEDISIRSTVIRTRDDVLVTVPNSILNSSKVINESVPRRKRRIRVPVSVAYGTDYDLLEETLLGVASETKAVLDAPSPRVRMREFGDSALQFELLCWVPDPVLRGRATHDLNVAIYRAFEEAGIEVPFPQREVRILGDDGGVATVTADSPEQAASGADDD
ncbi:mechanosensitive ion channel family protein [Halorarius litoreus]|uniref:mechanosensitive ion channel family protein n=1 Tax=Halorarius litoreus TaxID=2962676 RepID=UPI0020CD3CBC|nr:mechanosensitive ion channel family protein [Halorarius litoreus]